MKAQKPKVKIWTDGACKGNPGVGGWGALLISGNHQKEIFGGALETTNNRMELQAVIEALAILKEACDIDLHIDSSYVKDGITSWIHGWKKNNWRTAAKKPVKNVELWQELDRQVARHTIEWHWVKGHSGDAGNEKADELANRGVDKVRKETRF